MKTIIPLFLQKKLRDWSWRFLWWTETFLGLKEIERAVDDRNSAMVKQLLEDRRRTWGDDPELIRLDTLDEFLNGE